MFSSHDFQFVVGTSINDLQLSKSRQAFAPVACPPLQVQGHGEGCRFHFDFSFKFLSEKIIYLSYVFELFFGSLSEHFWFVNFLNLTDARREARKAFLALSSEDARTKSAGSESCKSDIETEMEMPANVDAKSSQSTPVSIILTMVL